MVRLKGLVTPRKPGHSCCQTPRWHTALVRQEECDQNLLSTRANAWGSYILSFMALSNKSRFQPLVTVSCA